MTAITAAVVYVVQYRGHSSRLGPDLFAAFEGMGGVTQIKYGLRDVLPSLPGKETLVSVLGALAGLIGLLAAPLVGLVWIFRRQGLRLRPGQAWLLAVLCAGLLGSLTLSEPATDNQMYFVAYGLVGGCLLSAEGLRLAWRSRPRLAGRTATLVALGGAWLLALAALMVVPLHFDLFSGRLAEPHRYLVWYAGLALALALLYAAARTLVPSSRWPAAALVCAAVIAVGTLDTPIDSLYGAVSGSRLTVPGKRLTPELYGALSWIRDETPTGAVIAVNNQWKDSANTVPLAFDYSAFSERRVFLEGWLYSQRYLDEVPDDVDVQVLHAVSPALEAEPACVRARRPERAANDGTALRRPLPARGRGQRLPGGPARARTVSAHGVSRAGRRGPGAAPGAGHRIACVMWRARGPSTDAPVSDGRVPELSVVLPAFNEEANIGPMIEAALTTLPGLAERYEVIVVDDGSRDGTADVAQDWMRRHHPTVRLLAHDGNRGYGAAIRTGLRHARDDLIFYTDADRQFDIAELADFLPLVARARPGDRLPRLPLRPAPALARVVGLQPHGRAAVPVRVRDVDCALQAPARASSLDKLDARERRLLHRHRDRRRRAAVELQHRPEGRAPLPAPGRRDHGPRQRRPAHAAHDPPHVAPHVRLQPPPYPEDRPARLRGAARLVREGAGRRRRPP